MADERPQNVPPPSSVEINIRTMASDLAAMGHAGGVSGSTVRIETRQPAKNVSFSEMSSRAERAMVSRPQTETRVTGAPRINTKIIIWIVAGVLGAAVLFFLGFYVVPKIFG